MMGVEDKIWIGFAFSLYSNLQPSQYMKILRVAFVAVVVWIWIYGCVVIDDFVLRNVEVGAIGLTLTVDLGFSIALPACRPIKATHAVIRESYWAKWEDKGKDLAFIFLSVYETEPICFSFGVVVVMFYVFNVGFHVWLVEKMCVQTAV